MTPEVVLRLPHTLEHTCTPYTNTKIKVLLFKTCKTKYLGAFFIHC